MVDNLYLDMNGIIHNCTHGNDPGRKITEQEMIIKVFGYLEKLFQIVQPQKLLFMAIDGMLPTPDNFVFAYTNRWRMKTTIDQYITPVCCNLSSPLRLLQGLLPGQK